MYEYHLPEVFEGRQSLSSTDALDLLASSLNLSQSKKKKKKTRKAQPFPDTKRKRKPTNPDKHKSNKRTKSTKIRSLFPKRGNRNAKRTEKHKNKMTQGKT